MPIDDPCRVVRGSQRRYRPPRLWDDGLHYVRASFDDDVHPLKWCMAAHRATGSSLQRRYATLDEAILNAIASSQRLLKADPSKMVLFNKPKMPPASSLVVQKLPKMFRPDPVVEKAAPLPKFSVYHFDCIRANPIAQVWQCVSLPGERGAVGRRKAGGGVATQTGFRHTKGECAVMLWREPVREADGSVRVFPSWQAAEEYANDCYYNADEEERLLWVEDGTVVHRTENVDIIFDPSTNGVKWPFSLWLPKWRKPVYEGFRKKHYTTAAQMAAGGGYIPGTADAKAAHDFNRKLEAMDDNRVLTTEIATFKSIWGAEEHATNVTERLLRGERVNV